MPLIHVYLKKGVTKEYKQAISDGIRQAMMDVLGLPEDDYNQVTFEMDPEDMRYDPNYFGVHRSEKTIFFSIAFNVGRTPEVKKLLFKSISDNLTKHPGMRIEDIMGYIAEVAAENWYAYARTVDPVTGSDSDGGPYRLKRVHFRKAERQGCGRDRRKPRDRRRGGIEAGPQRSGACRVGCLTPSRTRRCLSVKPTLTDTAAERGLYHFVCPSDIVGEFANDIPCSPDLGFRSGPGRNDPGKSSRPVGGLLVGPNTAPG